MSDLEAIRELAAAEEREWREAERREREERRQEALYNAPLPSPDWRLFSATRKMDSRTFSLWIDQGRPALGWPKSAPLPAPPPAPQKPKGPKFDLRFAQQLGDSIGRLLGRERARTAAELALRDQRIEALERQLANLEAERMAVEPRRRSSTAPRRGSSPQH